MHLDLLVISFILDVGLVGVPAGVTQEEGHTGFLHLPSAMLTLFFLAIRIQPFLSLVDREVEFRVLMNQPFSICCAFFFLFFFLFVGKNAISCDCTFNICTIINYSRFLFV